jgi:TetR/AcrR family transcriptional regulator, cholesterol catabolism regulator
MVEVGRREQVRHGIRRQIILDAAADEFGEVGFEGATLVGIGERVGLSKAALYHYVDGKEQLLIDLASQAVTDIEALAAANVAEQPTAADRLRAFMGAHVEVAVNTPHGKVLTENLDRLMRSPVASDMRDRHRGNLDRILEDGIAAGEFAPVDVVPTSHMLLAALNSVPRWFESDGLLSIEDLMNHTTEVLFHGVLVGGERPL